MRRRAWAWVMVPAVIVGGAGAYAVADAADAVPGWITASPEPVAPAPFRTAQPAVASPPPPSPVTELSANAPVPDASAVQALAQAVRADPRTGTSTNVSVIDVITGDVLADVSASDTQVPASTTKLLTAIGAVALLGPDYAMATHLVFEPQSRTLTLLAGGDMMLAPGLGHRGAGDDANGWAGVGDLVEQALADPQTDLGAGPVRVVVDDLAFEGPAVNPDWPQYALDSGYVAPASGVAVNIGRMTDDHYAQRYDDPSLAAGEVLADALADAGVEIAGSVTKATTPVNGIEIAVVESAPLSEVAHLLLRDSDNTIAEMVGRVLALETGLATTPAGAANATIAGLESIGAPVDGLVLHDGAGFSTRNRISPEHLTGATVAALGAEPTEDLLDWLPLGGLEGTVGSRYQDTDAAGVVRAKTGSLTGVTALAGTVVTADGRLLAFAALADGMPYGQAQPRAAIDELVEALAGCGCEQ